MGRYEVYFSTFKKDYRENPKSIYLVKEHLNVKHDIPLA